VRYTFSLNKFCFLSFFPFLSQLRFQQSVFVVVVVAVVQKRFEDSFTSCRLVFTPNSGRPFFSQNKYNSWIQHWNILVP
jgi:hypothetical protein